jgi:hypothetical protein
MIILRNLIKQTEFDDVWSCLIRHYKVTDSHTCEKYQQFYEKLKLLTPNKNIENIYIYITVFKEGNLIVD